MTDAGPPPLQMMDLFRGAWAAQAITVAASLGLADLVAERPRTVPQLASAAGVNPGALGRLVRALTSVGVFDHDAEGRVVLTPPAELLRRDVPGSLRGWALFMGAPWHRAAWSELEYSVRTGQPALEHVTGQPPFDFLRDHPEAGQVFNDAMTGVTALSAPAFAAAYPFGEVGTLVDVGGGHGLLLATILQMHPDVRGVLYDLPEVTAGAGPVLDGSGVRDRCRIESGSFFEGVPRGADAYMMKAIIHDWDDERSTAILRHCRDAMRPGGRVLIVDCVVPEGPGDDMAKVLDLEMLVMTDHGRERTEVEFRALVERAGLRLTRIVPTFAPQSIVEARAA